MTLQEFSRDIVPILQLLGTGVAGVSLILLWFQMKQTTYWNRLQAEDSFHTSTSMDLAKDLHQKAKEVGIKFKARKKPLTDDEMEKIWNDDDSYYALIKYLNHLDTKCAKVRAGKVYEEVAFRAYGPTIVLTYEIYERAVRKFRDHYEYRETLIDLSTVAQEWKEKMKKSRRENRK